MKLTVQPIMTTTLLIQMIPPVNYGYNDFLWVNYGYYDFLWVNNDYYDFLWVNYDYYDFLWVLTHN